MSLADDLQAQIDATLDVQRLMTHRRFYLVLPPWMVFREGWGPFCERFEQSVERTGIAAHGFETTGHDGRVLRYTLRRYTETPTPEEDTYAAPE